MLYLRFGYNNISAWASRCLFRFQGNATASVRGTTTVEIHVFFMIHIGQLIKHELELQERTPSWLARKINCERPNVYNIFERKSIDTDLLLLLSKALNKDFFEILSKELNRQ